MPREAATAQPPEALRLGVEKAEEAYRFQPLFAGLLRAEGAPSLITRFVS